MKIGKTIWCGVLSTSNILPTTGYRTTQRSDEPTSSGHPEVVIIGVPPTRRCMRMSAAALLHLYTVLETDRVPRPGSRPGRPREEVPWTWHFPLVGTRNRILCYGDRLLEPEDRGWPSLCLGRVRLLPCRSPAFQMCSIGSAVSLGAWPLLDCICKAGPPKPCGCISAVACACAMSESGQNIVAVFSAVGVPTGETAHWLGNQSPWPATPGSTPRSTQQHMLDVEDEMMMSPH